MATVISKTVKASGGDYTSLAAFEAGEQRNLAALDEIAQARCANFQDSNSVDFASWTCDADRYIDIVADDLHGSKGAITTNAYRLVRSGGDAMKANSGACLHITGMQLSTPGSVFQHSGADSRVIARDCLFKATGSSNPYNQTGARSKSESINCIFSAGTGFRSFLGSGTDCDVALYNCVLPKRLQFTASPEGVVIKNCYVGSIVDGGVASLTVVTTATADSSGSVGLQDIALVDAFTDPTNDDYTLLSGGPLRDSGTDTSMEPSPLGFTGDFSQNPVVTRPIGAGWDIGAFEALPDAPVAGFSLFPDSGNIPLDVTFFDGSTGISLSYLWEFGDGNTSTVMNPSHIYTLKGDKIIRLTVTNLGGADSVEKILTVLGPLPFVWPIAEPDTWAGKFTASPRGGQFDTDRQTILDFGFTILDETLYAGRTNVFVYGPGPSVNAYRADTLNQGRMPAQFFLIPKGSEITVSLVKRWVPREDSTF